MHVHNPYHARTHPPKSNSHTYTHTHTLYHPLARPLIQTLHNPTTGREEIRDAGKKGGKDHMREGRRDGEGERRTEGRRGGGSVVEENRTENVGKYG